MSEKVKSLIEKYKEISEKFGLSKEPIRTDGDGKIIMFGKRWILMDVEAFPHYMIKTTSDIIGDRIAKEFVYWFGYAYGEKVAERYMKMGVPKEMIPHLAGVSSALYSGWGIPEFPAVDLTKDTVEVIFYNDFESESASLGGSAPDMNFLRGVLSGVFAKLISCKTHGTIESQDGFIKVIIKKR